MTRRIPQLTAIMIIALAISSCSAGADAGAGEAPSAGGAIELAVSETCADASQPQCVSVDDEVVVLPSTFHRAEVESATAGRSDNTLEVTFTDDGATVLHTLTQQAADGGDTARLVVRAGDTIVAAPAVIEALDGNDVQIALSPDDDPQKVLELIHAG